MLESLSFSNCTPRSLRGTIDGLTFNKKEANDHTINAVQKWLSISHKIGIPSYRVFCNFMISLHDDYFINKKGLIDAVKKIHKQSTNKAKITQNDWTNDFHQADNVIHFVTMK
jgi:hypothetical protein